MANYTWTWVHGHSVQLEHGDDRTGGEDIVVLGGEGVAVCRRVGWGAEFFVRDSGSKSKPKSGTFWIHYSIPTSIPAPQPHQSSRDFTEAAAVKINYRCTNINEISIGAVHIWDGNRPLLRDDSPEVSTDDYAGGILVVGRQEPDVRAVWLKSIGQRVWFGLGVSILIKCHRAREASLNIRGVGILWG